MAITKPMRMAHIGIKIYGALPTFERSEYQAVTIVRHAAVMYIGTVRSWAVDET